MYVLTWDFQLIVVIGLMGISLTDVDEVVPMLN